MHLLIIWCAKYLFLLPIAVLLWCLWATRGRLRRELFFRSLFALPLAYLAAKAASRFYFDPRPFVVDHFIPLIPHAADNGFPSDHMLLTASIAMVVFYTSRRLGLILWFVAFMIGFARVFAGVHHTIDIIGSAAIALLAASVVQLALVSMQRHR